MTAVSERGEVDFKEAGDGVILRFTNRDLKELQAEFDDKRWMTAMIQDMMKGDNDIVMLDKLARKGAKKDGKSFELPEEAFDKMTVLTFAKKVMDGLMQSVHGKTFEEWLEGMMAKQREAEESGEEVPPIRAPSTTTSPTSEESHSGPASE